MLVWERVIVSVSCSSAGTKVMTAIKEQASARHPASQSIYETFQRSTTPGVKYYNDGLTYEAIKELPATESGIQVEQSEERVIVEKLQRYVASCQNILIKDIGAVCNLMCSKLLLTQMDQIQIVLSSLS